MLKKSCKITLKKHRTRVEITDVDGWLYDLRYYTGNKETYYSQIIKKDVPDRISLLQREGFVILQKQN